jgi:hypothetical protein
MFAVNKNHALTRRMQLQGWGCGGTRKINRLFDLPLAAADAQTFYTDITFPLNNMVWYDI